MGKVREPSRKSSIEKKEHIIEIGFHMICEKGYHHVSTVDIAKKAGVSTGIIYQYFQDKHDILLAGIRKYSDLLYSFFFDILKEETDLQKEFFSLNPFPKKTFFGGNSSLAGLMNTAASSSSSIIDLTLNGSLPFFENGNIEKLISIKCLSNSQNLNIERYSSNEDVSSIILTSLFILNSNNKNI